MGMKDQFQDKAAELEEQARRRAEAGRDEASERGRQPQEPRDPRERASRERAPRERQEPGRQTPDEAQRASRDAQERFDQDYDM
ncbi:hypothetical protein QF035_004495 [Streptomyces umbrinus]|uniref:Uncharacterized protein n=1 Tax=Streptomyces umbrinus TaxID=67370 RepID=A0ABU0STP7_9ACTN|nr:hypothetical protein [Streptomyces umbrinus]MDQ1026913.1 hypothetical protein [Streptomyces umbrinus]